MGSVTRKFQCILKYGVAPFFSLSRQFAVLSWYHVCASACHKSYADLEQARWRGALRLQTHVLALIAASYAWTYRLHDDSVCTEQN